MYPHNRLEEHRQAPALRPGRGLERFDERGEADPRQRRLHLGEEHLPRRLLLLHRAAEVGKGGLLLRRGLVPGSFQSTPSRSGSEVFQTFQWQDEPFSSMMLNGSPNAKACIAARHSMVKAE